MRIIAGQYRSRPLRAFSGADTRPTADRLRETLFNVLTAGSLGLLEDSIWLDIFAGTGAVGLEALSRGARQVYFIDSSKAAVSLIRENLHALEIVQGFEVIQRDAVQALRLLDSKGIVCYLDPPYRMKEAYEETLDFLSQSRILTAESLIIAEHDKHFDPGAQFGTLERYRLLRQGDASLSFYRQGRMT
ncbi:MAG: 16S rRNA (guanine(966)-N(2))-methyltransferase RsmD [Terriglobales bacterium]